MNSDIRSFFTKKKVKIRYESNTLSEKRKQRKAKIQKGPRQATIESLGRVIVIEEFERCKGVLTEDNPSKERVMEALKSLGSKTPSRDILKKTNLGLIINTFRTNDDSEIAELAKKTYRKVNQCTFVKFSTFSVENLHSKPRKPEANRGQV